MVSDRAERLASSRELEKKKRIPRVRFVSLNLIKHLSSPCRAVRHSSAGLLWTDTLGSALEH